MSCRPFFIRLTPAQVKELNAFLKASTHKIRLRTRRRAQAVWFSHQGMTVSQIARQQRVSERSVWKWLKSYQQEGLAGLKGERVFRKLSLE